MSVETALKALAEMTYAQLQAEIDAAEERLRILRSLLAVARRRERERALDRQADEEIARERAGK